MVIIAAIANIRRILLVCSQEQSSLAQKALLEFLIYPVPYQHG
jgi:hypothetical protein